MPRFGCGDGTHWHEHRSFISTSHARGSKACLILTHLLPRVAGLPVIDDISFQCDDICVGETGVRCSAGRVKPGLRTCVVCIDDAVSALKSLTPLIDIVESENLLGSTGLDYASGEPHVG